MSKKIKFIKENDLFSWKVGDELETTSPPGDYVELGVKRMVGFLDVDKVNIMASILINKGYAEYVEDKTLLEQVEEVAEKWLVKYISDDESLKLYFGHRPFYFYKYEKFDKYEAMKLIEYIRDELDKEEDKGDPLYYTFYYCKESKKIDRTFNGKHKSYLDIEFNDHTLVDAIIDSEKLRPYLKLMLGVE